MATDPDGDVVTFLDANVGALTSGTNLFPGKMQEKGPYIPSKAVFVLATGGASPIGFADGSGNNLFTSGVQIIVRSPQGEWSTGQTLARAVRDALHHASVSGYIDVRMIESEPNALYETASRHYLWTMNFELVHQQ